MLWAKIDLFLWGLVLGMIISDFAYDHVNGSTYLLMGTFIVLGAVRMTFFLINLFSARKWKKEAVRSH